MTPERWNDKFTSKKGDFIVVPPSPELKAALAARQAAGLPTLGFSDADLLAWHQAQQKAKEKKT